MEHLHFLRACDKKNTNEQFIEELHCWLLLLLNGVYLGVRTCELFLCFVAIVRVRAIMLTSLFSLFYITGEFHRFLHRG